VTLLDRSFQVVNKSHSIRFFGWLFYPKEGEKKRKDGRFLRGFIRKNPIGYPKNKFL